MHHLLKTITLFFGILLATASTAADTLPSPQQLQDVCKPDSTTSASLHDVQLYKVEATSDDFPYFEARSNASGNIVRIYYEPDLANAAASKAACLMGMLDILSTRLTPVSGSVNWSPIVLTHNTNYIAPKRNREVRWNTVFQSTTWDPANLEFLFVVMPHEETHLTQKMGGAHLPRWFKEGHAEWAGLQITEQVAPVIAAAERARREDAFLKLGAAHLSAWGGVRVKPEAIDRQLSKEDRERRAKDPSFTSDGPFSFGPDDMVEDNGNEPGRYGAALALFSGLERRHNRATVQAWVAAVLESKDASQIVPLARQIFGEDVAPLLQ